MQLFQTLIASPMFAHPTRTQSQGAITRQTCSAQACIASTTCEQKRKAQTIETFTEVVRCVWPLDCLVPLLATCRTDLQDAVTDHFLQHCFADVGVCGDSNYDVSPVGSSCGYVYKHLLYRGFDPLVFIRLAHRDLAWCCSVLLCTVRMGS